jgi:hypothetical protein
MIVEVARGTVCPLGSARVGVVALAAGERDGPLAVDLTVLPAAGEEYDVRLAVGEGTELDGVTWVFDGVVDAGTEEIVIRLSSRPDRRGTAGRGGAG